MSMPRRLATIAAAALAVCGCQTAQIAKRVQLIAFRSDVSPGKAQDLRAQSCGIKVLGYGATPDLQLALSRVDVRYANNVSIDRDYKDYVVWSKDCWNVQGEGYK